MRVNLEARAAAAEQRKAQTRERLLEAAIAVIGEKGPGASSIEDFVAAAGVSRGTFYNYFPTTESLLLAVQLKITTTLTAVLDARLPRSMPACEQLATRLHSYLASVSRDAAWGWTSLRLDGSRLGRLPLLADSLDELFKVGVAQGRFHDINPAAVRTVLFGAGRMLQRDTLMGLSSPGHAIEVVGLLLAACGLPHAEAMEVSRRGAALAQDIHPPTDAA